MRQPFDVSSLLLGATVLTSCTGDVLVDGSTSGLTLTTLPDSDSSSTAEPTPTTGDPGEGDVGSGTAAGSTGDATTAVATTTTDDPETDTGGIGFCSDDPPAGYIGPFDAACAAAPQVGTFTPVLEWSKEVWATDPTYKQILSQPVVAPLTDDDGDGVYGSAGDMPAVLTVTYVSAYTSAGILRAVAGDGSKELLSIKGQSITGGSGIAVGDLDGDAVPEIVAITTTYQIRAFTNEGALKWSSPAFAAADFGSSAAPAIADMDADGNPEVVAGRVIVNGQDGTLRGKGKFGIGRTLYGCASFPADVDGDGQQEVVVGNALYRVDGTEIWSIDEPDGYPAVADFDGDGGAEIVVVANGRVRLHTGGGETLWDVANPAKVGGPPTIADYDGDGEPEIGVAGKIGYIVFDGDGTVLWQTPTADASSSTTGSAVYDFEGDGVADVVYADEHTLWVFSGNDGSVKLEYTGHGSGTLIEYPVIADVDNDGEVEIVLASNDIYWGTTNGLSILGDMDHSWRPGRKIWNQYAYNITNSIRVS